MTSRKPAVLFLPTWALLATFAVSMTTAQQRPAFPGAEGFGAVATGGRGGDVHKVTTLAATGPGSLQWALNQPGPRIIVFDVSGVIEGDVRIPHGDVTIAGQSAPGGGITIHGHLYTRFGSTFGNIVIRHIRVRPPNPDSKWPPNQHDAIQFSTNHTLMLDHIDASHGADEVIDLWGGATAVTLQWSAITFPIYDPENGWTHNAGLLNHRPCEDGAGCRGDTSPSSVDLNGWAVEGPNGTRFVFADVTLADGEVRTFRMPTAGAQFRNKGGDIRLLDAAGAEHHKVTYTRQQAEPQGHTIVF